MVTGSSAPIAVVGMGFRFPGGATDPEKLWTLLAEGRSCWTSVPKDRFNEAAFYHPNADASGTHNHRGGQFLTQDLAAFDAGFFQISPAEAHGMDPQQRILLETTYDAFENSGATLESVRGSNTAVYVAKFSSDYDRNIYKDTDDIPKYHTTGTGEAILANRISYIFDLKGPSITLDTGCSGSLVALHYACQSLRTGEVSMAIAGGVNLILSPDHMIGMTNLHMLNDEGKSYSFDSRGSGYGRGEGSAIVILKTLADAICCGDPIRGVICNTAVNQDGKTSGITFPSQVSQENLQRSIYEQTAIDPRTVGYVEAHGTGTFAGDLAEIGAIGAVFCHDRGLPLYVGSIKSNVGHLESASGLAGLIKAILVLEKGLIPPNADFQAEKAELKLNSHNIIIPKKLEAFGDYPIRRASVNSFGYGGTNAHVILEQAPGVRLYKPDKAVKADTIIDEQDQSLPNQQVRPKLFILSARSKTSLLVAIRSLRRWTSAYGSARDLEDLAYTLSVRRSKLEWRFAFVAEHSSDIMDATREAKINTNLKNASEDLRVTFVFTGQGAQWYAMGRELITTCSQFRDSLSKSGTILQELGASWNLMDELLLDESKSRVHQSWFAQPASTAIQIALVDLLGSIGIQPQTVLGHSSGEIAAAYAGGVLSQAAAILVSYHRSFVSKFGDRTTSSKGAMLAVGLSEEKVSAYIGRLGHDDVCVACVNSPASTTVSGNEASINVLHNKLQSLSVFSRKLNVDTAYHSHHMQEVSAEYLHQLKDLNVKSLRKSTKFISTVNASSKDSGFGPEYWVENLVSKVRFSDAVLELFSLEQGLNSLSAGHAKQIVIEVGPHAALLGPIRQTVEASIGTFDYSYVPVLVRGTSALTSFLGLTGKLFEYGFPVDFGIISSMTLTKSDPKVVHDLPTYPWDHSHRYWYESRLSKRHRFREHGPHDLLGTTIANSISLEPHWRHLVSIESLPWLQEHMVDGLIIFPGAAYMCMAIEAARQLFIESERSGNFEIELKDISFQRALVIPQAPNKVELHLSLVKPINTRQKRASSYREFRISALSSEGIWNEHCGGIVVVHRLGRSACGPIPFLTQKAAHYRGNVLNPFETDRKPQVNPRDLYRDLELNGNYYGPCFAAIKEAHMDKKSCLFTRVEVPDVAQIMPAQYLSHHIIHPTTLDALMHSALPLYTALKGPGSVMPMGIENFRISSTIDCNPYNQLYAETTLRSHGPATAKADIVVFGQHVSAEPVLQVSALELRGFARKPKSVSALAQSRVTSYSLKWEIDPDFLLPSTFTSSKSAAVAISHRTKVESLNRAALVYIDRSLAELKRQFQEPCKPHLNRLRDWMECQQVVSQNKHLDHGVGALDDDTLLEKVQHHGVEGQMLSRVGTALTSILIGGTEPLNVMLETDLLYRFYANDSSTRSYAHISQYLKYLCFKNPRMRILEIGAGTGSTTVPILTAISSANKAAQMAHYDFTDLSAGFFDKARDLVAEWGSLVTFRTLDISQDPVSQGFEAHSYDLIVASNIIHATSSIEQSLANLRRLLKPQGKLALIELTQLQLFLGLIFGILPGWWLGANDGRQDSPLLTRDQWQIALSNESFSGLDLAIDDFDGPEQASTFMVSHATTSGNYSLRSSIVIIADDDSSDTSLRVAGAIRSELELHGLNVSIVSWASRILRTDAIYMVIDNSRHSLLSSPTPARFHQIVGLMTQCTDVFWICYHADVDFNANPETALVTGLARTAHAENQTLRLVTLDIQQPFDLQGKSRILSIVSSLLFRSFHISSDHAVLREREYIYKDENLLIPRLVPDENVNRWMSTDARRSEADRRQTGDRPETAVDVYRHFRRPSKLITSIISSIDEPSFADDDPLQKPLGDLEVEIDVKAHAVNPGSLASAYGQEEALSVILECAGIITATGSKVSGLSVGDRVGAFEMIPYASRVRASGNNAVRLPDSIPFTIGASIPVAFMTAYHCLVALANLKRDQNIVVCAVTESVEQAAILIAKHIGAVTLAIVSSSSERDFLVERFDMPPAHILMDDGKSSWEELLNSTGRHGVDLILSRGSTVLPEEMLASAVFGGSIVQIVETGSRSSEQVKAIPSDKNLTFRTVDLMALIRHRPLDASSLFAKVMSLFETGFLQPKHSITVKPIAQIGEASVMLQADTQMGAIILESSQGSMASTTSDQRAPLTLDENGSYIIAGGLGDLGKRLSELMVRRGARHIVVLTRRTLDVDHHRKTEDNLQLISPKFKLYWRTCDIASDVQVKDCATNLLSSGIPPVRGIVQAALLLQDRTLSQMTLEDFNIPLQAKVHGTRNLYAAFENLALDFFVILSSVTGVIGTSGQANYAAGNAFQDAFANSRPIKRFPCVSLDIGLIEDAEVSNSKREHNLARHGLVSMRSDDLLSLTEYAMSPQATQDQCKQIITGFDAESLSQVEMNNANTKSPLFCHVWRSLGEGPVSSKSTTARPVRTVISESSDVAEVHEAVTAAIAQKLSRLVAFEGLQQKFDSPMAELGLDSLITTELKNWISTEFQAATQVSEILDRVSIRSLASLVASRSKFVQEKIDSVSHEQSGHRHELTVPQKQPSTEEGRISTSNGLPALPLPELDSTLSMYLESRRFDLSREELAHTSKAVAEFLQDGGYGRQLQGRLEARVKDPNIDNWLSEPYSEKIYLERRDPIHPTGIFYGGHLLSNGLHTQAERAAVVALAALDFKQSVEAGTVERDYMNGEPICMESLHWLFNAVREPRIGLDKMRRSPGYDYIIALRHGHIFSIPLKSGSDNVPYLRLKAAFDHVIENSRDRRPSVATLTADERNSWAEVREHVKFLDVVNSEVLSTVESAAFVVCLDDGKPSNASERCNQFFLGDPSNRWSDKNLQFVVCENGVSAFVGEHAMLDGMSVRQFNKFITHAILDHKADEMAGEAFLYSEKFSQEISFVTDPIIEDRISHIQRQLADKYAPIEFAHHRVNVLGNNFLRKHKCPSKAGYQVIIQLACLLYYGYQPESWETISMSRFHKGRVDWIQAVQPTMASFCAAARDNELPFATKRRMFFDAVNTFANTVTQIRRGHGFKAHLHALLAMMDDQEPIPALFEDQAWRNTEVSTVKTVKTDCLEGMMLQETAFLMAEPKCIFVHYEVENDECVFFVQAWPGRTKAICEALETAAHIVKRILESS